MSKHGKGSLKGTGTSSGRGAKAFKGTTHHGRSGSPNIAKMYSPPAGASGQRGGSMTKNK